ncbi:UNVERIFIED_CONTAM: hypothetical protein Sindi_1388900 [Sesamum indicum]
MACFSLHLRPGNGISYLRSRAAVAEAHTTGTTCMCEETTPVGGGAECFKITQSGLLEYPLHVNKKVSLLAGDKASCFPPLCAAVQVAAPGGGIVKKKQSTLKPRKKSCGVQQ